MKLQGSHKSNRPIPIWYFAAHAIERSRGAASTAPIGCWTRISTSAPHVTGPNREDMTMWGWSVNGGRISFGSAMKSRTMKGFGANRRKAGEQCPNRSRKYYVAVSKTTLSVQQNRPERA